MLAKLEQKCLHPKDSAKALNFRNLSNNCDDSHGRRICPVDPVEHPAKKKAFAFELKIAILLYYTSILLSSLKKKIATLL